MKLLLQILTKFKWWWLWWKTCVSNNHILLFKWAKLFKNGSNKICERQTLRNLLGTFLNTLPQIYVKKSKAQSHVLIAVDQKTLLTCICYIFLLSLCEKCPNTEFFLWFVFARIYTVNRRIQSEYGKIRTWKNFVFVHFSRSMLHKETSQAGDDFLPLLVTV